MDDEEAQRMTVHHQLRGIGEFIDFADPEAAIAYLRENKVEVAIVDIRMPYNRRDGLWFLSEVRQFDRDLALVVRTADDDINIAQAGIEARAIQRVIKSAPNARDVLRAAVETGIRETLEWRRIITLAADAKKNENELVSALGRTDDHITVASLCKGFVQGMEDPTTALASYAELLAETIKGKTTINEADIRPLIEDNLKTARKLRDAMNEFLHDAYAETAQGGSAPPTANKALQAIAKAMNGHPFFTERTVKLHTKEILPDVLLAASGAKVLSALRHMTEYCAVNVRQTGELLITLTYEKFLPAEQCKSFVLGKRYWVPGNPCAIYTFSGDFRIDRGSFVRDMTTCSPVPSVGNLLIVSSIGTEEQFAVDHLARERGFTEISLLIPTQQ